MFPLSKVCPECTALKDSLYGWDPLIRWHYIRLNIAPYVVVKEQCWGCGYHKAYLYYIEGPPHV